MSKPGATLLMLAFQATRVRAVVGGVSPADVETAIKGWETLSIEPAETTGLGWPLTRTAPLWYRLRRQASVAGDAESTRSTGLVIRIRSDLALRRG